MSKSVIRLDERATHRAPTVEDVAAAAGVSRATVSRALTGTPYVREETRLRVEAVAKALGYVPNDAARMLAARRAVVVARELRKEAV